MALQVSASDLARLREHAESLRERVKSANKKVEHVTGKIIRSVEVGAAAFAFGVAQGKTFDAKTGESMTVVGVPLDLAGAIALHGLGFFGVGGKFSDHLHNFGDGALGTYLATVGRGVGNGWREKALAAKPATEAATKGDLPPASGRSGERLSEEEIARLTR